MNSDTITHLQFIQNIIDRMNRNSFQIKEWTIAIVSGFLALFANSANPLYICVAVFPVVFFWFLDSYYLQQERKFRGVYGDVVVQNERIRPFQMPIHLYTGGKFSFFNVLFSKTILPFYGFLIVCLLLGAAIVHSMTNDAKDTRHRDCPKATGCQQLDDETYPVVKDAQSNVSDDSVSEETTTNAMSSSMTVKTKE